MEMPLQKIEAVRRYAPANSNKTSQTHTLTQTTIGFYGPCIRLVVFCCVLKIVSSGCHSIQEVEASEPVP